MTIERDIIFALVVSGDYTKRIKPIWRDDLIGSPEMQLIGRWCRNHFERYGCAPGRDIEQIFLSAIKEENIPKSSAELIEGILREVSRECPGDDWKLRAAELNVDYLADQTVSWFRERELKAYSETVNDLIERGQIAEAEAAARSFKPNSVVPQWTRASQIRPRRVSWLWQDLILRGDLTMLAGRPKTGKSQATMSIAAIASAGAPWPATDKADKESRPRDVVLMSAEDAPDYVMVPRLMANGADLERVWILDPAADTEKACDRIEACLDELPHGGQGALVIIDPISAFMPGKDSNQISHVRMALRPLSDMARERKVYLIVVHHLRKGSDGDALDAVNGTVGFTAAARMIHMVMRDPNRDDRRLLLCVGGNLAASHPGYAFQIVPETIKGDITISRVAWEGTPVNATADEIMAATRNARSKPKQAQAAEWLREQLRAGPRPQRELQAAATEADIKWATIRIVKNEIGVKIFRQGGQHGAWMWTLAINGEDGEAGNVIEFPVH